MGRVDDFSPTRHLGFYIALALVFTRFSLIHEMFTYVLGHKPYLVFLLLSMAVVCVVLAGGLRRTLQFRVAYFWCAFAAWFVLSIPFAYWRAGALSMMQFFLKTNFPMIFVVGGLTLTMKECRAMMKALALSALATIFLARHFSDTSAERLTLQFGAIANSNDLALHLLLTLCFLLFIFLTSGLLMRLFVLLIGAVGMWIILSTGSRAGLVSMGCAFIFLLLRARMKQRIALLLLFSLMALTVTAALPRPILKRLLFFSSDVSEASEDLMEAAGSQAARTYLAKRALYVSAMHPVFGVGPGEFADYEAHLAAEQGQRGTWQQTHNSYLEVSAEGGFPALIFYIGTILSAYSLLNRVYKRANREPDGREIAATALCLMLAVVVFGVGSLFLSLAYGYYLPTLAGLAIAFTAAAEAEWKAKTAAAVPA